jgi:hypothetical protein
VPGVIDTWATMASFLSNTDPEVRPQSEMTIEKALAEWQVRIAAQRVISDHLRTGASTIEYQYWNDIDLDLSGAALFDFDFRQCKARGARFRTCRFFGVARFYQAEFGGEVEFDGAEFFGPAWFGSARFCNDAWFGGSLFHKIADFRRARFERRVSFGSTSWLGFALFSERARFDDITFATPPEMKDVRVKDDGGSWDRTWPSGWHASQSNDDRDGDWTVLVEAG